MKATKKEINEYKKDTESKYGCEITYLAPNITKEDLKKFKKQDKRYFIKTIIKSIFKSLVDMFATLITRLLIWTAGILSLIELEQTTLAYFLFLGGIAYIYREVQIAKRNIKEEAVLNANSELNPTEVKK